MVLDGIASAIPLGLSRDRARGNTAPASFRPHGQTMNAVHDHAKERQMNTRSMVRIMMSAILLSATVPALAAGPEQYGHDDATYASDDFDAPAAVALGGGESDEWVPEAAHDDTTYPAGPAYVIGTEAMASIAPELGHDDAPYPALDEAKPRSEMPAGRIVATTPSSAFGANVPPAGDAMECGGC